MTINDDVAAAVYFVMYVAVCAYHFLFFNTLAFDGIHLLFETIMISMRVRRDDMTSNEHLLLSILCWLSTVF